MCHHSGEFIVKKKNKILRKEGKATAKEATHSVIQNLM
jgi:hypothetical protein